MRLGREYVFRGGEIACGWLESTCLDMWGGETGYNDMPGRQGFIQSAAGTEQQDFFGAFGKHFDFFDLAAAQIGCRIRLIASGLNEPDGFEIVGTHELGEFFAGIEMSFSADCNRHKKSAGCLSFPRAVKLKFCQLS